MKHKTFIITFILFLALFFTSLILISVLFFNTQVKLAKERVINEHYLISNTMGKEFNNLIGRGAKKEDAIEYLFNYYSEHYSNQKGYIQIFKDNILIYNSFQDNLRIDLKNENIEDVRIAVYKRLNNIDYIAVSGKLPKTNGEYTMQYNYDITSVIKIWTNIRNALLITGIGFSLLMAILLIVLLNIIFKPLGQVVTVSKEIAEGNYKKRINLPKKHELASLADSFNDMAEKVQSAITDLSNDAKHKQQFIDNFSHEIRTPLASAYGFAEYMQKSVLEEEERIAFSGYIMDDIKHILSIADRLLDLATLRNLSIKKINYSVCDLYKRTEKSLQNRLLEKQISLVKESTVLTIYGDSDLLQSLLINITNNAIDASEYMGLIKWQTYSENGFTVLSVSDNGKGMPSDEISKIDEPFYRINKSRSRESGNAGLGLSICKQIAECHNARIIFDSKPQIGTTVKVIFTCSQ